MTLQAKLEALSSTLDTVLGDALLARRIDRDELTIDVDAARIFQVCRLLKDTASLGFTQLSDLSGVDYLTYGQADWQTQATSSGFSRGVASNSVKLADTDSKRFAVAYQLLAVTTNLRLRVKAYLGGEPPRLASVSEIWPVADWYEREVFDLFGILFDGHPDLRRILTDYGFIGHPFRKDFPLSGNLERRYDPDQQRVIYQPVTIEPREIVPRIVREENYADSEGFRKG